MLQPKNKRSILWNYFAIRTFDYGKVNRKMLHCPHQKNEFRTVFVDFDDSPRRGNRAVVTLGSTPKRFGKYLRKALQLSRREGNEYLFINAWNEWGEGNYLEPDTRYGYSYLNQVKEALQR